MKKTKELMIALIIGLILFILPNISQAAVNVTKNVYSNNGSAKYQFTGLELNTSHDYEFGVTKTESEEVTKWHLITEKDATSVTIDLTGGTTEFADIIRAVTTGYVTIRDKNEPTTIVVNHHAIDLSIPYLNISNYSVINNGKEFGLNKDNGIQINFWKAGNSQAYYQYEKITDQNVINKYKEIKSKNGNYNELQSLLKTQAPTSNWNSWKYWNGYMDSDPGYGYPQSPISVPDSGLYYMWIYIAGNNIRNLYGYILVDNLQPEIALDSISLPKTQNVELGKTLTLTPTFSPSTTTNKIVTWSSSDESVATVDNAGKITPKKLGSTIITVTSQDGTKKATCTVTVVAASSSGNNNSGNGSSGGSNGSGSGNSGSTTGTTNGAKDPTTATGSLPYTGVSIGIITMIILVTSGGIYTYLRYKRLRGI